MHFRLSSLAAGVGVAGLLLAGTGLPAAAADITKHGGAQRNNGDQTDVLRDAINGDKAKNVILLIGDGMGDSEITVARNYEHGASGEFPGIDALPITGQYTTYALDKSNGKPDYVTDSAASGSGWATGTKTYNGAISVDIDGKAQRSILQIARANGLKTGNVSTAEIQDATPAVLGAHVSARKCYGPEETTKSCPENALENGGAGSITEQLIGTRADVTFGGGAKSFAQTAKAGDYAGKTLREQAEARGYQLVEDKAGMEGLSAADQNAPVLGLFSEGNMPVDWQGPKATRTGGSEAPVSCTNNPGMTDATPRLRDMTGKAIDLLKDGKDGFFLQVESASIDKEDHAANPCGQIGETVQMDEAVQEALDFAKKDGNTLVVVTADHAHSSQIVYPNETTMGLTRTLTTKEGQPMTVAYGTADEGHSQMHTGSQVRIAAYGPQAANVHGLTDQTDLFFTMKNALDLDENAKDPEEPTPTDSPSPSPTDDNGNGDGNGNGNSDGNGNGDENGGGGGGQDDGLGGGSGGEGQGSDTNAGGRGPEFLPRTGVEIAGALAVALALVAGGAAALRYTRRQGLSFG